MRVNLPGLLVEQTSSGATRYRVRVEGQKWRRIAIPVGPDHPDFGEHYAAARAGETIEEARKRPREVLHSVDWLTRRFEEAMRKKVSVGAMSQSTLHQRSMFYAKLRAKYGAKAMEMPRRALLEMRDEMIATPGAADNFVKSVRALYAWAIEQELVTENPAAGISRINHGTGATPWTVEDLEAFRKKHPQGTMAHLALSLFTFTACRIGDIVKLGRANEIKQDGLTYLDWQPSKKGSARVTIPILPPLARAISAQKVIGPTYLLTAHGKPFASSNAFDNRFRSWCESAGLKDRSAHGIRKAAGELMALSGATQYHIMAVHGHTQARTSEGYTAGVNRRRLAAEGAALLAQMDW